eukprot:895454-Rhodomonas_salina.1
MACSTDIYAYAVRASCSVLTSTTPGGDAPEELSGTPLSAMILRLSYALSGSVIWGSTLSYAMSGTDIGYDSHTPTAFLRGVR